MIALPIPAMPVLAGWRRRIAVAAAALAAGLFAALAHPPFGFLPGLLGYALLMVLAERTEAPRALRSAFWRGWLAGFAYFFIGCWWVAEAFLVDARQAWMAPFAASLLPAGLGLFWGAACALYRRIAPAHPARILVFASALALFEWLRGHVLTGFPWNLPGETWKAGGPISQNAAWAGAYGLTWITIFAAAAVGVLAGPGARARRLTAAAAGVLTLTAMFVAGAVRLHGAREDRTPLLVRIVQPDVPQESKWSAEAFRQIVERYLVLTAQPAEGPAPAVVIWPEGALPAAAEELFAPGAWTAGAIADAVAPGQVLLMGTYRGEAGPDGRIRYYNSLLALRGLGGALRVEGVYDKHRLVPFGEYLPLESVLGPLGVKELVHVGDGFSPGSRPTPMRLSRIPAFQPLICYESLFPGLADGRARARWIVNVSNDAWFGRTSGPLQHLNLASYRAIEQGMPVIRATPTGVSAVIDAYGRIRGDERLEPGQKGVIDAHLPATLENTYFSRTGDLAFWLLTATGFLVAGLSRYLTRQALQ